MSALIQDSSKEERHAVTQMINRLAKVADRVQTFNEHLMVSPYKCGSFR